jgi:hypothetical protein
MKILCAWCERVIREPKDQISEVTHGICRNCFLDVLAGFGVQLPPPEGSERAWSGRWTLPAQESTEYY